MGTIKRLYDILWSIVMTIKDIHKYGLDNAHEKITKELRETRLEYWKVTGKHPDRKTS